MVWIVRFEILLNKKNTYLCTRNDMVFMLSHQNTFDVHITTDSMTKQPVPCNRDFDDLVETRFRRINTKVYDAMLEFV